jgi:hypothetical protein
MDKLRSDGAPDMEGFLTLSVVAVDTGSLLHVAYAAPHAKPIQVESSFKLSHPLKIKELNQNRIYLLIILIFKPDLVVPVDAHMVHPLFGIDLHHGSLDVGA